MSNWIYTNIQHQPRKVLGISVLEYCVLDYVYKTQVHPDYAVNGWAKTGCHKIGEFLGVSSGTIKGIFDRMEKIGLLERLASDLKRVTDKFYSIAYETDVQKLNTNRSETEHATVQKLNTNRSETEHNNKVTKTINKDNKRNETKIELHEQLDNTKVELHDIVKEKKTKYITAPALSDLVPIFLEKLQEKQKQHPQIVDCWNWANHQAEKFHLHHEQKGWKIQKLNSAIATWINGAIGYGTVTKPCPIKYKGNQPIKVEEKQVVLTTQLSKEDVEKRKNMFANALNAIG